MSDNYLLTWETDSGSAEELELALKDIPYDSVETRGADGNIHGMLWMLALQVGKPVLEKIGAFVDKHLTGFMQSRKVGKVTLKKDGQIIIEGATVGQIKKILEQLEQQSSPT